MAALKKNNMNKDQILSLLRSVLKMGGAWLAAKGMADNHIELVTGIIIAVAGVLLSYFTHTDDSPPANTSFALWLCLGLIGLGATGCSTVYDSNKITAVKERGFGIMLAQSPANQSPEIKLGFFSSVVQIIPTSTNGAVEAPRYMDTIDITGSANPFSTAIKEVTGTGQVQVGQGTNDTSKAIIASPYIPPTK